MAVNLEAECYFCGNPNAAGYCSSECQAQHWKLGHKEDCRAAGEQKEQNHTSSISIHKADYHSYIDTLPDLDEEKVNILYDYHVAATKDSRRVELANSIDYPLPGPTNTFSEHTNSCKLSSRTDKTRRRT
jgi:hypothetical protein